MVYNMYGTMEVFIIWYGKAIIPYLAFYDGMRFMICKVCSIIIPFYFLGNYDTIPLI